MKIVNFHGDMLRMGICFAWGYASHGICAVGGLR